MIIGADNDDTVERHDPADPSPPAADQSLKKSRPDRRRPRPRHADRASGQRRVQGRAPATTSSSAAPRAASRAAPGRSPQQRHRLRRSGSDTFIWAPGDGSDAFVGGNPAKAPKKAKVKTRRQGQGKVRRSKPVPEARHAGDRQPGADLRPDHPAAVPDEVRPAAQGVQLGPGRPHAAGRHPAAEPEPDGLCEIVAAPAGSGLRLTWSVLREHPQSPATWRSRSGPRASSR